MTQASSGTPLGEGYRTPLGEGQRTPLGEGHKGGGTKHNISTTSAQHVLRRKLLARGNSPCEFGLPHFLLFPQIKNLREPYCSRWFARGNSPCEFGLPHFLLFPQIKNLREPYCSRWFARGNSPCEFGLPHFLLFPQIKNLREPYCSRWLARFFAVYPNSIRDNKQTKKQIRPYLTSPSRGGT